MRRLTACGRRVPVEVGDLVFAAGEDAPDLILVHEGTIEVVQPSTPLLAEEIVDRSGPGEFSGELAFETSVPGVFAVGDVFAAPAEPRAAARLYSSFTSCSPDQADRPATARILSCRTLEFRARSAEVGLGRQARAIDHGLRQSEGAAVDGGRRSATLMT